LSIALDWRLSIATRCAAFRCAALDSIGCWLVWLLPYCVRHDAYFVCRFRKQMLSLRDKESGMFILPDAQERKNAENIDYVEEFLRDTIRRYSHLHDQARREEIARLLSEQIIDACADGLMEGEALFVEDPMFTGNSVDDDDSTVQLTTEWDGATNEQADSSIEGFRSVWSEIISDTVADQLG
jgi:hypothetical protein